MNGAVSESVTTKAGTTSLALACIVVWVIAAASTGPLGIWLAIGGSAVALGAAVLVFDRPASTRAIRPSRRSSSIGRCGTSPSATSRKADITGTRTSK